MDNKSMYRGSSKEKSGVQQYLRCVILELLGDKIRKVVLGWLDLIVGVCGEDDRRHLLFGSAIVRGLQGNLKAASLDDAATDGTILITGARI